MNVRQAIFNAKKVLTKNQIKSAGLDCEILLSKVLQKDRKNLLENVAKQRARARSELLKNLNPIIKAYMQEKRIRYVMDKKSLILADESLDLSLIHI